METPGKPVVQMSRFPTQVGLAEGMGTKGQGLLQAVALPCESHLNYIGDAVYSEHPKTSQ